MQASPTPSARAAATRRIRRRAAEWREISRRDFGDIPAKVREHIAIATRPNDFSRPALSTEAILWQQFGFLCDVMNDAASRHLRSPARLGNVRCARVGMAALLDALRGVAVRPQPVSAFAIKPGDQLETAAGLVRVIEVRRLEAGCAFALADGQAVRAGDRDALKALRPADFEAWNNERLAREKAEHKRQSEAYSLATYRFDDAYIAAFAARDWPGVRSAVAAYRAALHGLADHWTAKSPRGAVIDRIGMLRELPEPPRWRWSSGRSRRGFDAHIAAERTILAVLHRLRALAGYDPDDRRAVVTVRDRYGKDVRVSGDSLRGDRWGDWVARVNAAGAVTKRTGSIHFDNIAAILHSKARRSPPPIVETVAASPLSAEAAPAHVATAEEWREADVRISAKHDRDEIAAREAGNHRLANLIAHRRSQWKEALAAALEEAKPVETIAPPAPVGETLGRGEAVALDSGERGDARQGASEPVAPVDIEVNEPDLAAMVADLAARVAALEGVSAVSTAISSGPSIVAAEIIDTPTAKPARSPAHERAIRRAWKERRGARIARAREAEVDRYHGLAAERAEKWQAVAYEQGHKRRRSTILARHRGGQMATLAGMVKRSEAALAGLRRNLADPATPDRASDVARLMAERDAARTANTALEERCARMQAAVDGCAGTIEALASRVAIAEAALRAKAA